MGLFKYNRFDTCMAMASQCVSQCNLALNSSHMQLSQLNPEMIPYLDFNASGSNSDRITPTLPPFLYFIVCPLHGRPNISHYEHYAICALRYASSLRCVF